MGKPVNSNVSRAETTALNIRVNKEVFESFKGYCSYLGYPMNVVLEIFMCQYANRRFTLSEKDALKFKNNKKEDDILSTTFNKEIYLEFKNTCKSDGYFVKHIVTAFMEKFANGDLVLEYINIKGVD